MTTLTELEEPSSPESVESKERADFANMSLEELQDAYAKSWLEAGNDHERLPEIIARRKAELEVADLRHDLSRQIEIASELATENAELAARVKELEGALGDIVACERFTRSGGATPEDLALYGAGLIEAVEIAHAAIAGHSYLAEKKDSTHA